MYKFIGDSILNASFTVQVPKPLDNRTVVANIYELYSIPPAYAYEGMTVANIDNGNIYMLVNKSKIGEKAGWKASYESIQIIACELREYKEWQANTNELFQPIDELKEYLHQDTYYYIYEDSLDGQEELQEYVRRSDWMELLNEVTNSRATMGQLIAAIRAEYASLEYANSTFAPLTMFDLDDPESYMSSLISNYYTKEEADEKFVTIESLQDDENFIFVTNERYHEDQEALSQYQQDIAEQLSHLVATDSDASLNSLVVGQIRSPQAGGKQLIIDVTAEGLKVGNERYAFFSEIPNLITVTKSQYEQLVANQELIEDAYYYITGDDESYVLRTELENNYYNRNSVTGLVHGWAYSKEEVDNLLTGIQTSASELYFTKEHIQQNYVDNESLTQTLENYVTLSMINEGDESIFLSKEQYQQDQTDRDLLIESTYVKKDSDASLNSLETSTIKNGANTLTITNQLNLNDKKLAFDEDIPKLVTLTKAEYEALIANDELDEDAYYHITDDTDTYVLISQLADYYTKTGVQSYIAETNYTKQQVDNLINSLSFYTQEQSDNKYVTKTSLETTLEDYVTVAMLGGDDMEGQFIFVKASDYQTDKEALATQRQEDLLQIDTDYVKKDSDATLNSLETSTIKNGQNTLLLSEVLKLNNEKLALDKDVPVIRVVTAEEYEQLTKDPNVYYFVYNTDPELGFVTAKELENYYTKPQIDSKFVAMNDYSGFLSSDLFIQMHIKFNVEKILMERIADNQYYQARACGNHIDITEFAPEQSVLTTTGTGLVSFLRHLITNDTELGNDVLTITLSYNDAEVVLTESGSSTDNPSTVSVQLVGFLRQATGKATGDIKQSDLNGKILNMRVSKDTAYVDYKVAIKSA